MKKRTTKTKVMGAILSTTMVLSMLAGCGTTDSTTETTTGGTTTGETAVSTTVVAEADTTPITFKIAVTKHALSKCDDFNDKVAFQMAEEATGVHIEWVYVEDGAGEKVNTMLTADMPDAFLGLLSEEQVASSMESFLDISGMLEQYAPHVYADYNKMQLNGLEQIQWPDGSIRSLLTGPEVAYANDAEAIQYINKDWLDQLNLDMPTTVDELYDVLCAFRDNDIVT